MPITIEFPDLETQTSFNLARWKEILADPELAKLPYGIETDQYGRILMSPPPASRHGRRQMKIGALLLQFLPRGETISECPVSTAGERQSRRCRLARSGSGRNRPGPDRLCPRTRYLRRDPFAVEQPSRDRRKTGALFA